MRKPDDKDKDGLDYEDMLGWYEEYELDEVKRTPWVSRPNADSKTGFAAAHLITPELMSHPNQDFASIHWQSQQKAESLRKVFSEIFDKDGTRMRSQYKGQGIWPSEEADPWVLGFERFHVDVNARRQGLGKKSVRRVLEEVIAKARLARKTVVVLVMPAPPEREINDRTAGLSVAKWQWREEIVTMIRAFWRSIGFVRVGEKIFFGWTRNPGFDVLEKSLVRKEDLDRDADIDRRHGYLHMLKK